MRPISSTKSRFLALFAVLLFAPLPAYSSEGARLQAGAGPVFEYATSPDAVVLRYQRILGGMRDPDPGPSVTLYGDGRVHVHYPRYMKRAGEWTLRLPRARMDTLLRGWIIDSGLAEFDAVSARTASRQAELEKAARGELYYVSDPDITSIELNLSGYRGKGETGEVLRKVSRSYRWSGLQDQVRRHPGISGLAGLASVERDLLAILGRDDLVRFSAGDEQ